MSSILSIIENEAISPTIKEKLDKQSDNVNKTYTLFKKFYGNAFKSTVMSSIINGEIIETKPENIFIDQDIKFNDPTFEQKCKYCAKELYDYQKNAIKKIRELELRGNNTNAVTNEKITSNGWLLSLPIGSGKSLVFQFISLFYRDIPTHPIIISTDGQFIPEHDQMQWKFYPYYYENCAYTSSTNGVIVMENYIQRPTTIILTHIHLLEQMQYYFETDFPIVKQLHNKKPIVSISYPMDISLIDVSKFDIIVVPATQQNVNNLVKLSWEQPFLRVIIDDYTSMPNIDSFRQILASSTIFVSGSGFERKFEDIPASYYTMKYLPVSQMSLVGKPEETLEGIFRDNIATMKLMGSHCEFSQYEFVMLCEDYIKQKFNSTPLEIYPIIKKDGRLINYLALMFILKYFDRIKSALLTVEKDLVVDKKTNESKLNSSKVSYYLKWKDLLYDLENNPPKKERQRLKDGTYVVVENKTSNNPLYNAFYNDPRVGSNIGSPLVMQKCMSCMKKITDHNGYGMIACCCGAFYCSDCLKSMCTRVICDKEKNLTLVDEDNYYCCCCREKNSKYFFNVNKKKDTNVYSYNLVNDFFDTTDLQGHINFDYYFYMLTNGFKPLYCEGKPLNIHNDIEQGGVSVDCFNTRLVPKLEKILPKDQLGILAINIINKTLVELNIAPHKNSTILLYGCPKYMTSRVNSYYQMIVGTNDDKNTINIDGKRTVPISLMNLDFKDNVASLIGLHKNIIAIIQWETPDRKDELNQLIGRILRLNNFNNKLYFYIAIDSIGFE